MPSLSLLHPFYGTTSRERIPRLDFQTRVKGLMQTRFRAGWIPWPAILMVGLAAQAAFAAEPTRGDVRAFGAVGDGKADDTVAIQNAVETVQQGTVYLPPGVYRITAPIMFAWAEPLGAVRLALLPSDRTAAARSFEIAPPERARVTAPTPSPRT
jgi:hypothetical protein